MGRGDEQTFPPVLEELTAAIDVPSKRVPPVQRFLATSYDRPPMVRLSIRTNDLRALFARSGNRCAFPGCTAPLVSEKNLFIAQVCHIEVAELKGERFNPQKTDEQRRAYDNLILLCYPRHVETDDAALYPPDRLRAMKAEHEMAFGQKLYQIDESLLHKVDAEISRYWEDVAHEHREHHVLPTIALDAKTYEVSALGA